MLQPQSAPWASLVALAPWNHARVTTYILRQQDHGLARYGFLQVQKRPGRPELEIVHIAPDLDAPHGHPAIWEKLLAHHNAEAAQQAVLRVYAEVPDQPLPIHTLNQVGFRSYARQTIWRLSHHQLAAQTHSTTAKIRPQTQADAWALQQLYVHTVPKTVQVAEGMHAEPPVQPPILEWQHAGLCESFVLERHGEVAGSIQIVQGRRGYWLQLWADMNDPDTTVVHELLRYGLNTVRKRSANLPVYVGVCEYHGGLSVILDDHGFAPITDRVKLMRPVVQWIREPAMGSAAAEAARRAVTATFTMPLPIMPGQYEEASRMPPASTLNTPRAALVQTHATKARRQPENGSLRDGALHGDNLHDDRLHKMKKRCCGTSP